MFIVYQGIGKIGINQSFQWSVKRVCVFFRLNQKSANNKIDNVRAMIIV